MRGSVCRCFSVSARRSLPAQSTSSAYPAAAGYANPTAVTQLLAEGAGEPLTPNFINVRDPAMRQGMQSISKAAATAAGVSPDRIYGYSPLSSSLQQTSISPLRQPITYEIPPLEDPLLSFLTNLMMSDGKKARARNHVSTLLTTLRERSSSQPLPLLREAIRLASPNIRIAQQKRGGKNVSVPIALGERQRVHKAISWILDASDKRKNPNSGGSKIFGERVAIEVEAVLNGTSDVLKKKEQLHAMATVNRANVSSGFR